jgi:predicted transcriptional regulator
VLTRFTGTEQFYDGVTVLPEDVNDDGKLDLLGEYIAIPGSSHLMPGYPAEPVVLQWETFQEAADEAGLSRQYGGIHFQDGDLRGRELGKKVGAWVFEKAQAYWQGQ